MKAGASDLDADLFEFRFSPPAQERITNKARVTTLDGCKDEVVVSAAQREVGLTDHIQELQGGTLAPVDKHGVQPGSDPHVSADCRILYIRLVEADPELINEIVLFDPAKGSTTSIVKGNTVAGASWGPNGEILVLKRGATGPVLVVVKPTDLRPRSILTSLMWATSNGAAADGSPPAFPSRSGRRPARCS